MGYRLHCATKYEVEYSGGRFNHKCEEFHDLLQACDATYTGESCDNEFEVTKLYLNGENCIANGSLNYSYKNMQLSGMFDLPYFKMNNGKVITTEWKKAIDNLRNLDNLEEEEQENIKNALKWMTDSREEIIEDMEYLLSKADPSHDFLHLSFY